METTLTQLSTLNSPVWTSNLDELSFKQFKRTYSGGYSFNFVLPLSGFVDTKTKTYSNFFLTRRNKASDYFTLENTVFEATRIRTYFKFGESYLAWGEATAPFKTAIFVSDISDRTFFDLEIFDNQMCRISCEIDGQRHYLMTDVDENVFFIEEFELDDLDTTLCNQPYVFKYMYDPSRNYFFLFRKAPEGYYSFTKDQNDLVLILITDINKQNVISNRFIIGKDLVISPDFNINTSFITYNNDNNNINPNKSVSDLANNFLLHNNVTDPLKVTDIIILKNQMDVRDKISSSNNLLSGEGIYVNNMRNYTSICDSIQTEVSTDLELNYVFSNLHYEIKPGKTTFVAPSSMYPFTSLNINDTKFTDSGAFSFDLPAFADKVYKMDRTVDYNDQHYLCTWLSGSPLSDEKVWVDRYYYPDLITKAEALSGKNIFNPTYEDLIEQLIQGNVSLGESIQVSKFFDKISDLTFVPNEKYVYERISLDTFAYLDDQPSVEVSECNRTVEAVTKNYFKTINEAGKITFSFYFMGDNSSWVIQSDRNNINSGIRIEKTANTMTFVYTLYNPSTAGYQTFEVTTTFKKFKENFVCFGLDLLTGQGYVYFNNASILDIDLPVAQYIQKQLLYGDIFFLQNGDKTDILQLKSTLINTVRLTTDFSTKNVVFIRSIFDGKSEIDTIKISLPCGTRNNFDNINLLQTICGNDAHRSNRVSIKVKNLNVNSSTVIDALSATITQNIQLYIPSTTIINDIEFLDFK